MKSWRPSFLDSIAAQAVAALLLVIFGAAVWATVLWNLGRADNQRWHDTVRQEIALYQEDGDTDALIQRLAKQGVEATYEPSYQDAFGVRHDNGELRRNKFWVRLPTHTPTWAAFEPRRKGVSLWAWGAGMAILAGALSWLMAWHWVRPLRRLAEQADDIVRGQAPAKITAPLELAQLSQALEQAATTARTAAEERKLFLAGVSHDLRQPLARVKMALAIEPLKDQDLAEGIERDIDEMDKLLGQFIEWVRDGQDEVRTRVDLEKMVVFLTQTSGGDWQLDVPEEGEAIIHAPPLALRRAIANLLHNAHKHGQGPFNLKLIKEEHSLDLYVIDHGQDCPPKEYTYLFEPFKGMGARAGAGLGLAVVHRVITHLRGKIELLPTEGGGWTVKISLPQ